MFANKVDGYYYERVASYDIDNCMSMIEVDHIQTTINDFEQGYETCSKAEYIDFVSDTLYEAEQLVENLKDFQYELEK